jgi:hypothetical protein
LGSQQTGRQKGGLGGDDRSQAKTNEVTTAQQLMAHRQNAPSYGFPAQATWYTRTVDSV